MRILCVGAPRGDDAIEITFDCLRIYIKKYKGDYTPVFTTLWLFHAVYLRVVTPKCGKLLAVVECIIVHFVVKYSGGIIKTAMKSENGI